MTDHPSALVSVPLDEQVIKRLQEEADHPGLGDSVIVFGPDLRAVLRAYRSLSTAPAAPQAAGVGEEWTSDIEWLREAARYFQKRDTKGEDAAFWSNLKNSENANRIANKLKSLRAPSREPEGGAVDWSYDLTQCPRSEPFLIAYADGDVRIGHYLDNSKSSVPWEGIRPLFGAERWDAKIIAWAKRPALTTREEAPAPTCQKCGGEIAGWCCQQCPAEFRENDAGVLIAAREEAPAEAGDWAVEQRFPELNDHLIRMASTGNTGSLTEWAAFWDCLRSALRAQPQAREDAQPVISAGKVLADALRQYGFPVSGGAKAALSDHGSAEALALNEACVAFLAALQAEQGAK